MRDRLPVVVIGAGPAGLTAGLELARHGAQPLVLEKADRVGGIARTETYQGFRFDIGGHRFFTKNADIQHLWEKMLGDKFLDVPRLSRIYYRGRFFKYPLDAFDAVLKLGPVEGIRILLSYLGARLWPSRTEENLEDWMVNRFGRRLYTIFFKSYTEKLWGIPCHQIESEWAAQRIRGLNLSVAVTDALFGRTQAKSLIKHFHYPLYGPGMMWERFQQSIEDQGGRVSLGAEALRLRRQDQRIVSVAVREGDDVREVEAGHVISSMCLPDLILRLDPPPPDSVLDAARFLGHRSLILVGLILDKADSFPDQWLYIHSPELRVGRIQNFGNWSPAMVPDLATTGLGMEYFCSEGDPIWQLPDSTLVDMARRELVELKLAQASEVVDGVVFRQPAAYPVYDSAYREHIGTVRDYLDTLTNLQTVGRNGMHRYNNQDHSMLTAMLAVRNWRGERHDLWSVNTERSHNEEKEAPG